MSIHGVRSSLRLDCQNSLVPLNQVRLFPAATLLLLSWGALALGSEYAWAYAPPPTPRSLVLALALVVAAVLFQLVPLPSHVVATLSPAGESVNYQELFAKATFRDVDTAVPAAPDATRPLSVEPSRTWLGLVCAAAFALLLVGSVRGLSLTGVSGLARGR